MIIAMIQVNLLPPEYRTKERAPMARLLGVAAGAIVASLSMAGFLYMNVVVVKGAEQRELSKASDEKRLRVKAKEHDDLMREMQRMKKREKQIVDIKTKDVKYAPLMLALARVVWDGETHGKFKGWYTDLRVEQGRSGRGRKSPSPEVVIKVLVDSPNARRVAAYHDEYKASPYLAQEMNLEFISDPGYIRREFPEFTPPYALEFEVKCPLYSYDEKKQRADDAEKARKRAAPIGTKSKAKKG